MQTSFRGIFLTAADPAKTADFYQRVAGLPLETIGSPDSHVYWRLDRDGVQIAIHDAAAFASYSHPPVPESNLTHLYFHIDDHAAFLAHIATLGITAFETDEVTVALVDPDGRKVLFGTA